MSQHERMGTQEDQQAPGHLGRENCEALLSRHGGCGGFRFLVWEVWRATQKRERLHKRTRSLRGKGMATSPAASATASASACCMSSVASPAWASTSLAMFASAGLPGLLLSAAARTAFWTWPERNSADEVIFASAS